MVRGLCDHIGRYLYLTTEGDDFEGRGFEPDLLVNSKDALDRTLKMIKYYNINERHMKKRLGETVRNDVGFGICLSLL